MHQTDRLYGRPVKPYNQNITLLGLSMSTCFCRRLNLISILYALATARRPNHMSKAWCDDNKIGLHATTRPNMRSRKQMEYEKADCHCERHVI